MTDNAVDDSEYDPSPAAWVRDQVGAIEAAGDTRAVDIMGRPVVLLTMRGAKSGRVRKVPLMRVEYEGSYAVVASKGGAPEHPVWYHNLLANPRIEFQDGTERFAAEAHLAYDARRAEWWPRCVAAFPPYAEYQG